ncbi:hypothetical protein [Arvimicrobium flavum]|uniref:hypothetical protein n=1 Tax=Arvimicrobium flavum TaxID=3393320 RepID=UPI00237AED75|nr:hypothetical protein [Mesorhizobium shangrilense]
MQRVAVVLFAILLAGCQSATGALTDEKAETRPSVPTLSGGELQDLIVGKSLRYSHYGAVSTFFADRRYAYRDYEVRDGGTYSITGDTVCIMFEDGGRRCDRYARIGSDYYRIEEGGRQTKVDGVGPA